MKKILSLRVAASLFALLLSTLFLCAPKANAQIPIGINTTLFRFFIPGTNGHVFLTTDYQEGLNLGYQFWDIVGTIQLPPAPGWVPVPGQGLVPIYRWRVPHVSGMNYYYSGGLWPNLVNCSECVFEGLKGYALIPSESAGGPGFYLHLWYSQEHGYYYASNGSATIPPGHPPGSYTWQGLAARLPIGFNGPIPSPCLPQFGCYQFTPPPPPTGGNTCDAGEQDTCNSNGGTWNSSTCSCTYLPPDPCRQIDLTTKGKDDGGKESDSRPMPTCRPSLLF